MTFETLITILTIENLNSWQSLLPDNQEWHWTAFAILAMFTLCLIFCLSFMVYIQDPFYYFSANKKYPLFSILQTNSFSHGVENSCHNTPLLLLPALARMVLFTWWNILHNISLKISHLGKRVFSVVCCCVCICVQIGSVTAVAVVVFGVCWNISATAVVCRQ